MIDRNLAFERRVFDCPHIRWAASDIARIAQHLGVDGSRAIEALPTVRRAKRMREKLLSADASKARYSYIISTGSVDRMGDVIDPNGWQLAAFKTNPVVLWAHDSSQLPVRFEPLCRQRRGVGARLSHGISAANAFTVPFRSTPLKMMLHPGATFYFSDVAAVSVSGYLVKFKGA
jgi:hypothetical protein